MDFYFSIIRALREKDLLDGKSYPQLQLLSRARDADNEDNLAMRTADPLWMLGRQWQFGEFIGEDNGSPIQVIGDYYQKPTDHYARYKGDRNQRGPLLDSPLEAKVEAMEMRPEDLRSRVKIGQRFERIIRRDFSGPEAKVFIDRLRERYALAADEQHLDGTSRRFWELMRGRSIDGAALLRAIQEEQFSGHGFAALALQGQELQAWHAALYTQPTGPVNAWRPKQLLHKFEVRSEDGHARLLAPDYRSGELDWYSFDRAVITSLPEGTIRNRGQKTPPLLPVNLSFAGMPEKRLFAFEDNRIDLGDMDIQDDDLIRMMLLDFSLASGSDWYTIPLVMEMGALCWINQVEVLDVFGVQTIIRNGRDIGPSFADIDGDGDRTSLDTWDVFKIRNHNPQGYRHRDHFLFLAPAIDHRQESPAIEEVLFLRDEFANMVWGIEKRLRNQLGKTVEGFDLHLELQGPFRELEEADKEQDNRYPKFRLATNVPANWIPYLPRRIAGDQMQLHRATMVSNESDVDPRDIEPLAYLTREELERIREEAIPKAGVRVQLTKQRVRWTDGKTYLWMGRKVLAGKGEGDSGLRFDTLLKPSGHAG